MTLAYQRLTLQGDIDRLEGDLDVAMMIAETVPGIQEKLRACLTRLDAIDSVLAAGESLREEAQVPVHTTPPAAAPEFEVPLDPPAAMPDNVLDVLQFEPAPVAPAEDPEAL